MTEEKEKVLIYFKNLREQKLKDYSTVFNTAPKGSVVYEAVSAEIEIYDMAIKALKQEDILNKIRAEIEASKWTNKDVRIERNALASGLDKALEIIDKYRESEG